METIINVDDVSFSYGTQTEQALSHISLSVNKGDFIGIIGPSGAGKSTLAACLSGAVPHHYTGAFFGSVMVDGHDTCEVSLTDVSQIVGSVLQDIDTQMVASVVEDEMLFGLENFGVPHDQIEQRVSETLETVGISDLRDRRDRHPLGRTEAKGSHRRHPRHASARLGSRRAHRGTRPRQLHIGLRDAA